MAFAYELVMETLAGEATTAREHDPAGHDALRQAKWMRREAMMRGGFQDARHVEDAAETSFGLPVHRLTHWDEASVHRPWMASGRNGGDAPG